MTDNERCNLCAACPVPGACCYQEGWNPITRERTATRVPCDFLDVMSGSCRVYPERHAWRRGACLTIQQMLREGTVPPQCAYIDNPHAYAARPTRCTDAAAAERSRRRYGWMFWRFYRRQRNTPRRVVLNYADYMQCELEDEQGFHCPGNCLTCEERRCPNWFENEGDDWCQTHA